VFITISSQLNTISYYKTLHQCDITCTAHAVCNAVFIILNIVTMSVW